MLTVFTSDSQQQLESAVFHKIKDRLQALQRGELAAKRILLIVPAQYTLKAEEEAFEIIGGEGFFDFHIMSGNKLLETVLRETGHPGLTPVNNLGRTMLLRRIASENAPKLKRFSAVAKEREFLKLAGDFIVQLKQNRMESDDLDKLMASLDENSLLREKLADMQLLCSGYEKAMAGRFTDSEDRIRFVTEKVSQCRFLQEAELWYFGFYSFTLREIDLLTALARYSCGLNLMLLKSTREEDEELYQPPHRAAALLFKAMAEQGIGTSSEALPPAEDKKPQTTVLCSSNPFTQAETIGAEILRLVREEKKSFGEIAVLTAENAPGTKTLVRVFSSMGIPYFIDSKRSMMHTPAAALLSSLLDMSADGLREENIITFLKQGLVPLADEDTCLEFENYIRRYHLRGKAFLSPLKYGKAATGEELFARLEQLRDALQTAVEPFLNAFGRTATAQERCNVLYHYLDESLHLPQTLQQTAVRLAEEGFADAAEETAQTWKSICSLLDQTVELLGGEELSPKEFRDLIEDAVADIAIGVLPQAEGRVQIGTVTRSRLQGIRCLFAAGVNEGEIPSDKSREALLTEKELEGLEALGYILSKRSQVLAAEERLAIHTALTSPVDRLWLCWCQSSADGEGLKPSSLISDALLQTPAPEQRADLENSLDPLPYLQGRRLAERRLFTQLRKAADSGRGEEALPEVWKAAYNSLRRESSALQEAPRILYFDVTSEGLKPASAEGLFAEGSQIYSFSPSRLEKFSACPFSHFVKYGLRPGEPDAFELNGLSAGTVYHDLMMELSIALSKPARAAGIAMTDPASLWMTVSDRQLEAMVEQILTQLSRTRYDGLLSFGPSQKYQTERMHQVAFDFARQMVRQVRRGTISNMYFEQAFGRQAGNALPPIVCPTPAGTVYIEGRIDRIDMLPGPGGDYAKIIDYKSGAKVFDRKKIEQGLALQLTTYLEGAMGKKDVKPAGMFYFRIREASLESDLPQMIAEAVSQELEALLAKEYSLSGLAVDEPFILNGIDSSIRENHTSDIIGYKLQKNGKIRCNALISREDFEAFLQEFRTTLETLCTRLTGGEITPMKQDIAKDETSCTYCPYGSICLYDLK